MLPRQILLFLLLSLFSVSLALAVPVKRQEENQPNSSTTEVTPVATPRPNSDIPPKSSTVTVTPTATPRPKLDGDYIPPSPPPKEYFEDEGADGKSDGFINVSIGAQAGIIIAIVIVGLGIMGGCIWFWKKKQKEWKAALERRRTLRASRIAAKKEAKKGTCDNGFQLKPVLEQGKGQGSSSIGSTEVKVVDTGRNKNDDTQASTPWWKKVLPGKK